MRSEGTRPVGAGVSGARRMLERAVERPCGRSACGHFHGELGRLDPAGG